MTNPQPAETQLTPAAIIAAVRSTPMSVAEYAELILAVRESIPDLRPPDKSLLRRMSWAARLSPRFVQSVANGLESSSVWQASADATPDELHRNLDRSSELRPLAEQAQALDALVQFNTNFHHFVAADKARIAYAVGAKLGGNEGKAIGPHLKIARDALPKVRRTTKAVPQGFLGDVAEGAE
jgi:hypothetical protein